MKDRLEVRDYATLYRHFISVRRKRFNLTLWERDGTAWRPVETMPCAIGAQGYATPPGPHFVFAKTLRPDWLVPNSPWAVDAGLRPGTIVPFDDPDNPIEGAFLRLTNDGVGIHGTNNLSSLGHAASHGCIRIRRKHAVWLYHNVPVGTPVYVV